MEIAMILASENHEWGFWGTVGRCVEPAPAWAAASIAVASATHCGAAEVRAFLDSTSGRHFADDVLSGLAEGKGLEAAVEAAVARWMGWRIGRRTSRETGIPAGLPYLVGYVAHHGICEDTE
jgi:hypothetical protein